MSETGELEGGNREESETKTDNGRRMKHVTNTYEKYTHTGTPQGNPQSRADQTP